MALGLIICLAGGLLAMILGEFQSVIGGPMIGLFLGVILCNVLPAAAIACSKKGAKFSSKYLLKLGIILAGGTIYISRAVADRLKGRLRVTSLGDSVKLKGKAEGFEVLILEEII